VKARAAFTIVRDALLLGLGIFVIMFQQITGRTNLDLLIVALIVMQIPGALGLIHLIRGKPEIGGTVESPSRSHSEHRQ
jgi:hypothetical protein